MMEDINRKLYEDDLHKRQQEHLDLIQNQANLNWRPCMHDNCPSCHGTGQKLDGGHCVHGISCPCPKCTVTC